MLVLFIPWVILILNLSSLILLCCKKWRVSLLLLVVVFLANSYYHVFPLNFNRDNSEDRDFKVMSWNIDGSSSTIQSRIQAIAKTILKEKADVVFIAEDHNYCNGALDSLLKTTYPYSTYSFNSRYHVSHHFYSKYPLGVHTRIAYDSTSISYIVQSSVNIDGSIIDLFGCHLTSNNYSQETGKRVGKLDGIYGLLLYCKSISEAAKVRAKESNKLVDSIKTERPTIVMGDFNDISGSSALDILENNGMFDAWTKGGLGYGATIHTPFPYRIDHIYYNDNIKLNSIKKIDAEGLSDHDALIGVFEIEK